MGHPDFRVPEANGRIFASLGPPDGPRGRPTWGMVKLPPDAQVAAIAAHPEAVAPASGAWGRQGCTIITLAKASQGFVRGLLQAAWRHTAPKKLVQAIDAEEAAAADDRKSGRGLSPSRSTRRTRASGR